MLRGYFTQGTWSSFFLLALFSCFGVVPLEGQDPNVEFRFTGAPCVATGEPGSRATFEAFPTIKVIGDTQGRGLRGWSLSLTADGGEIIDFTTEGCMVRTNVGPFHMFETAPPPRKPDFLVVEVAGRHGDDPEGGPFRTGAVMAVVLKNQSVVELVTDEPSLVGKLRVATTVPPAGETDEVTLRYEDGFVGGGQAVPNLANLGEDNGVLRTVPVTVPVSATPDETPCQVPLLEEDVPETVVLSPGASRRSLRFRGEPGRRDQSAIITIDALDPDPRIRPPSRLALYAKFGSEASPQRFVRAATEPGSRQRLVVPLDREGDLFLRVIGVGLTDFVKVVVLVDTSTLALEDSAVLTAVEGDEGYSTRVKGSGFDAGVVFSLVPTAAGKPVSPRGTPLLISSREAELAFDLSGIALDGSEMRFDLRAEKPDGVTATLPEALTLVPAGDGALVTAAIAGHRRYRINRWTGFSVRVANRGDEPAPTPLLRLSVPDASLRVAGDDLAEEDELFVLAPDLEGLPDTLPPGAEVEVPFTLRYNECGDCAVTPCPDCVFTITCEAFSPGAGDLVRWNELAPLRGLSQEEWDAVWPGLSSILGATYEEVLESYGRLATRLNDQKACARSVRRVFEFAYQLATGAPASAIAGRLRDADTGEDLAAVQLLALENDVVRSSALTDEDGTFALRCLDDGPGRAYDVVAIGYDVIGATGLVIPEGGDLLGLDLGARRMEGMNDNLEPSSPNCVAAAQGLPQEALPLPQELFDEITNLDVTVIGAFDPNEKEGSPDGGDSEAEEIRVEDTLNYTIYFENDEMASAALQKLVVTDTLTEKLDIGELSFEHLTIGGDADAANKTIPFSEFEAQGDCRIGCSGIVRDVPVDISRPPILTQTELVDVRVEIEVTGQDGGNLLTITVTGLDDEGNPLIDGDDPDLGWLAPNDDTNRGEGHITLAIQPDSGLAPDTEITNEATIVFDEQKQETTNQVMHTIGFFEPPPQESILPLAPVVGAVNVGRDRVEGGQVRLRVTFCWEAERADSYRLFVWEGTGPRPVDLQPQPVQDDTLTCQNLLLDFGTQYSWEIEAVNRHGSSLPPVPWAFTTKEPPIAPPPPPTDPGPENGETNVSTMPRLSWTGGAGLEVYEVFLWESAGTRSTVSEVSGTSMKSHQLTRELPPGVSHTWQVIARNASGRRAFSDAWEFTTAPAEVQFLRADANGDGTRNLTDAVVMFGFLFLGDEEPPCLKSLDADDSGANNVSDAIILLNHLFLGGDPPMASFDACGPDVLADDLTCLRFPACGE